MTTTRLYRFDRFVFDSARAELTSPTTSTKLPPQPARLLLLLLENPGQILTRDRIRETVWPNSFADFDQSLHTCIRRIRAALRERAGRKRYIETLPRRGYRLLVDVTLEERTTDGTSRSAAKPLVNSWNTPRPGFPLAILAWLLLTAVPAVPRSVDSVRLVGGLEAVLPHLAP